MCFFDRKTMYFVWYREDGQARSVGSAQLTVVENVCRIEVSVTNCGRVDGEFPCYMLSGPVESLLGMLHLNRGKGTLSVRCEADKVGHAQVPYGKLTGIHVDLKEHGYLEQRWLPLQPYPSKMKPVEESPDHLISDIMPYRRRENDTEKNIEQLRAELAKGGTEMDKAAGLTKEENEADNAVDLTRRETETGKASVFMEEGVEKNRFTGSADGGAEGVKLEKEMDKSGEDMEWKRKETKQPVHLYPDKWQQLCAIYPIVHPFGDARGYLSIEPRDFVILQERYQAMAQNSFLLHGFYNYRHLLLGRQREEQEMNYYLGVPGVLYEKERSAALFYGFEGFESAKIPAQEGSFGYYMKRVQI
ncbi:MAG: hypothetical protein LUH58_04000 [Lachnospiraceae bacterium]|nr:hypothetical protein [Lachnospiraceae bacterium]